MGLSVAPSLLWIQSQPNLGRWGHQTNGTQVCEIGSYSSGGTQPASNPASATIESVGGPESVCVVVLPQPVAMTAIASTVGTTSFFLVSVLPCIV